MTWNEASTGVSWTNLGADGTGSHKATADGTLLAPAGPNSVDVTTSVQNWSSGEVNEGWLLKDTGSGGVDIRTSEDATVALRPMLTVTYVPPPAALLARYWMEEASSGQAPTQLLDDQASPVNLPITYDGADYSYTALPTGRGWTSTTTGNQGRATALVNGTKIQTTLDGATAATIEVVLAIDALNSSSSRIFHIGDGSDSGYFTLSSPNANNLYFYSLGGTRRGQWNPGFDGTRAVFHLVYDSSEPTAADRVRLYKNGTLLTSTGGTAPPLNETLSVPNGKYFAIANRELCCWSFDGAIYYAAVYDGALTASEVSTNQAALLVLDDSGDLMPPDPVADLATGTVTSSTIDLSWTAPGDDAATGTATTYDVRYSTSTITAGNWASATQATGEPSPQVAGSGESFTVTGLSASTTYFFAIKTSDEVPNESTISNVPSAATSAPPAALLARYWMEEASSGQAPTQLLDDQASPLNLPITYDGANYSYTVLPTGRGWTSTTTDNQGRATTLVDGTKIQTTLDGATAASIELVLAIDALSSNWSRIIHIGDGSESGYFTLSSQNATTLNFYSLGATLRGQWNPGFDGTRAVFHLVYDSSEPTAGDRVRLYKNGTLLTSTSGTAPPLNETLSVPNGKYFAIANRELCCRSFDGAIYYAALYDGALTASEVSTNQAALLVLDDSSFDLTPPAAVADLATGNVRSTSVQLSWTAPGDDGATGTATSYDIRYSTSTITEGNWAAATQATGEPAPQVAGSSETFTVTGLSGSTTYYFAIKTSDEIPNESAISNVPSATTDLDGMTQTGFAWSDDVASFTSKGDDVTLDAAQGTTYIVGIQVSMTQGAASGDWVLQVREDGAGSWLDVFSLGGGESPVWETDNTHTFSKGNGDVVATGEFGNGTAPTYFTGVDGEFSDDNNGITDGYTGPDVYTELQYAVRASGSSDGHTYEFRVLYNGAVLDAYNTYATVADPGAPSAVSDLATGTLTSSSVQLNWTAPGDNGATGTATSYDVRYSTAVINDGNWASATQATGEPAPQVGGSAETFTVTGLSSTTTYYFAIKTSDEVPNESALSNVPSATTLNGAPTVAAAIADTTVAQDNPPVDNYRDLKVVFTDFEDGSALTYTIQANTNAALVTPTIGADSALDLSFTAGLNGAATITVRATDSGTLFVDDVFTVTVLDGIAPDAITDLATGTVTASSVQLSWTAPGDDGATGTATTYDVRYSTAVINDGNWASATQATGEPAPQVAASSETFTVTGLNSSTLYYFAIKTTDEVPNESALSNVPSATTLNGAPTVAAAIADTTVNGDNPPVDNYRDLKAVFTDFEDGSALTYTIQTNTNPGLITPTIGADSALDLSFAVGVNGAATITVRATDSGALFVDDVFTVTVLDTHPPDAVTDLTTGSVSSSSVQLTWTAPGDDGATGTATSYDVRYSTSTITEGNWAAATQASGEPSPKVAGGFESFTVTGLSQGTTYHFAIKTSDEVPNQSAISNVPSVATIVSASVTYQKGDGKGSVSETDDAKLIDGGSADTNYGSTTDLEIDSGDKHMRCPQLRYHFLC